MTVPTQRGAAVETSGEGHERWCC